MKKDWKERALTLAKSGISGREIGRRLKLPKSTVNSFLKKYRKQLDTGTKPKVLLLDIELFPMEAYIWSLWQDRVGLNMLKTDWSVLSYAAKWLDEDKVFYEDVEGQKNLRDDKKILKGVWKLLDEADIVIGHNSISFDIKKLNSRFALNGMGPPSTFRQIDTMRVSKKVFSHTSNKLQYLTDKYCKTYKKLKHGKFPGFELWEECLKGNKEAFKEMKKYNKYDVLSLEELYKILIPWDTSINFGVYDDGKHTCSCGSQEFSKNGYHYTNSAKYQRHKCKECGAEYRDKTNLLSKEKKKKAKVGTRR